MTSVVLPFRARRAGTRALALVREQVKVDLQAYQDEKNRKLKEPLALRAALVGVRIILACMWVIALVLGTTIYSVYYACHFICREKWDGRYPNFPRTSK